MRGGYQIIDCLGIDFTVGSASLVTGAYEAIEGTRKLIRLNNVTIGGVEYHDTICDFKVSDTSFVGTAHGYTVTVDQNDNITFTE